MNYTYTFHSNGKLLITGEYVVLDGAISLAIPTKFGQSISIKETTLKNLNWKSLDYKNNVWFEDNFDLDIISKNNDQDNATTKRLLQILNAVKQLNPDFLDGVNGLSIETKLDFPNNWGLGTSSTLINNIAKWANVDAYKLLDLTFGGSGYDIACAQNDHPITYQLDKDSRIVKTTKFDPVFNEHLYFVHLNKKQNSREGIAQYKANKPILKSVIRDISNISESLINAQRLDDFETLINKHELIISNVIKQQPIKQLLFKDFKGSIKSLGAWGGDFVLATSREHPTDYFNEKGYNTILSYSEMIK